MLRLSTLAAFACFITTAQTRVDLKRQAGNIDFSEATFTKPVKIGTSLPATCSAGEAFAILAGRPGSNLFLCTATNIWTAQGSNGTGSNAATIICSDTGSPNTLVCNAPTLSNYSVGLVVYAVPANTNTGPATINVNSLGSQPIVKTGTAALKGGELQTGVVVPLIYDGANFRAAGLQAWVDDGTSLKSPRNRTVTIGPSIAGGVIRTLQQKLAETVSVTDFGADPTGTLDSLTGIQAAINYVGASGGGTVLFPPGTYKIDSSVGDVDNTSVRHNIEIYYDNVTLQGQGSVLIYQTANAVSSVNGVADLIRVGNQHDGPQFQYESNGGLYAAAATSAGDVSVTLSTPADAAKFAVGSYIGLFNSVLSGTAPNRDIPGIVPAEHTVVTGVNASTGVLTLKWPLARAFPSNVWVTNGTAFSRTNIALQGITFRSTSFLEAQYVFGLTVDTCTIQFDTTLVLYSPQPTPFNQNINSIRGWRISNSTFEPYGTAAFPPYLELYQRASMDGVFENNKVTAHTFGFGEYNAHVVLDNNQFNLGTTNGTNGTGTISILISGRDVRFQSNTVWGLATASGSAVLTDAVGVYESGNITIQGNHFYCGASYYCVEATLPDTRIVNNIISGSTYGIVCNATSPANVVTGNTVYTNVPYGMGIVTQSAAGSGEHVTVSGNVLIGSGSLNGIWTPATGGAAATGGNAILGNTITGYRTLLDVDFVTHPGTRISGNPGVVDH